MYNCGSLEYYVFPRTRGSRWGYATLPGLMPIGGEILSLELLGVL